ncbi:MAG: homocysteine methyltransferase [Rhodobacter sp. CACIA14H1]|nr:MAG: homocysteine methyltransferase [Rhodobacter sp. CACIA14H1]
MAHPDAIPATQKEKTMQNPHFGNFVTTGRPWITDAGLETSALFHEGLDLPEFAAFTLLDHAAGRDFLTRWFDRFYAIAAQAGTGLSLDLPTWRANAPWLARMGRSADMDAIHRTAAAFARATMARHPQVPAVLNGLIGPMGDGYDPARGTTKAAAQEAHAPQARALAAVGADYATAMTMTTADEAKGVLAAASAAGLPAVISFTVETDGNLPSGQPLHEAIAELDAEPVKPLWFMVNCAHPDHFAARLQGDWCARIGGIRANASRLSHAELDAATELDDGDPQEFGSLYAALRDRLPNLRLIGGCCGSDHRHVAEAGRRCLHHAHA